MASLLLYLLKSSLCLAVFALLYHGFLARSTHFSWMRRYLLASVALSLLLPLIPLPALLSWLTADKVLPLPAAATWDASRWLVPSGTGGITTSGPSFSVLTFTLYSALLGYATGLLYKTYRLIRHLKSLQQLIRDNRGSSSTELS
ncbi:MAG: hypothetical protein WA960_02515 [Tunicatimonas sp.]